MWSNSTQSDEEPKICGWGMEAGAIFQVVFVRFQAKRTSSRSYAIL